MPREKLYFSLVLSFFIFYFLFNFINTAWSSSETLSDYDSGKVREKMREVEKDDDRGWLMSLRECRTWVREMLSCMREVVSVCVVVVVLMVGVGVVLLMVVDGSSGLDGSGGSGVFRSGGGGLFRGGLFYDGR